MKQDMIAVIDLGSRENTVVARAVRALGVYSEIHPHDLDAKAVAALPGLCGFILCGGENNVVDGKKIDASDAIYGAGLPIFVIAHEGRLPSDADVFDPESPAFKAFVEKCAHGRKTWNMENFIADQIELVRAQVGDGRVLLALSGGVDSSVVAALLLRAIGDRLTCVHVNHGLLRKGEPEQVVEVFRDNLGANLVYVDAVDRFLSKLEGVSDPEQKRKIIGAEFIRVFEEEARKLGDVGFLGQGTIYPDIVESGTKTAKSVKSHHNVGGLPDDLKFELVEPLKMLFKDEVRECGRALGLPDSMVDRQPFPGPGLGVRCVGAITRDRLEAVRESDAILREEFAKAGRQGKVWQYFTIVPDFKSTGVRDGVRSYDWPVVIRAVNTVDAMTASVEPIDWALLEKISARIFAEVKGVNRVLYDCTPKPPATIEWE
jgi:GMP synthase (glutamine-hydrolysing)